MYRRILAAVILCGVSGCAEGNGPGTVPSGSDAGVSSNSSNSQNNLNSANSVIEVPDTGDGCELCCPGDWACLEDGTLGRCASDGKGFIPTSCAMGEVCENGACITPPVCTLGEKRCYDATTVLTCRASGDGFATSQCADGETCFNGECGSGDPIGSVCTSNDACVSNNCHCGPETDESCPAEITQGYCTTTTCDSLTCGQDSMCVAGTIASLGNTNADYDHCVRRCAGPCEDGFECRTLPIRGENGVIDWAQGCYFAGMVDIGMECATDGQCAAGTCLTDYFADTSPGYCTRRCDQDGACPDGSACVALKSGEFYCSLLCGDGSVVGTQPCPLDAAEERFDVTCKRLNTPAGNPVRVCAAL